MSKLFAGPWVGEFGWELMMWQGHIRTMAKEFDEVIVSARPGHEYLYEDFSTLFVPVVCGNNTDGYMCSGFRYNNIHLEYITSNDTFFPAKQYTSWDAAGNTYEFDEQTFIKYGVPLEDKHYDIIFHARNTDKHKTGYRNFDKDKWNQLSAMFPGHKKVSVGTTTAAFHIDDTDDLRDISLKDLSDVFASSTMIVGPSSGPMHLASLCGLHHIVITPAFNIDRYNKYWNPLHTSCDIIVDSDWNPPVEKVRDFISLRLQT